MNETLNEIEANEVTERDMLAVVYRVERLEPIPLKDRIELVHLKDCGYTAICEKGHQVGDLVVFVKYDTVLPKVELFSFMVESKYRVKTKGFTERDEFDNVLKKIYSQGIVLPLSKVIDHLHTILPKLQYVTEGYDLTELLEIKKYIPPAEKGAGMGSMQSKGDFPTHLVSKTDELNLASRMRALEELQGKRVYITLKIEGSSLTFGNDDNNEFFVASRNNMLVESDSSKFWQAVKKNQMKEKLIAIPEVIMQSELYGVGVQKNKLGIPDVDLMVYNMVDRTTRTLLSYDAMNEISKAYGVPLVPVVCIIEHFDWDFDKLQEYADIMKYPNGEVAEGIVIRPCEPFFSNALKQMWSVKVINREYKL